MRTNHPNQDSGTNTTTPGARIVAVCSWAIVAWTCYIFLGSLPYKFSNHPDTRHIFSTIGDWMTGILGNLFGSLFSHYGAYLVGTAELLISLLLLSPVLVWLRNRHAPDARQRRVRARRHALGGLAASTVMAGAVFFHLFTPLGIEVLHQGQSDGGSLFRAAVSILTLGIVLFVINRPMAFQTEDQ